MKRVARVDVGTTGAVEKTPLGGIRVLGNIARVGVLPYEDRDGNRWNEFVPAETLFDAASHATLRDAPVTDLHPSEPVTADNHRALSRGHVADSIGRDQEFLVAPLVVQDLELVAKVDAGERREISAGYTCDVDPTPGEFEGQRYDAVQKNRVYNHIALLPVGSARAGRDAVLRMDGAAIQAVARTDASAGATMKTIKIGGKTFRLDDDKEMAEAQKAADAEGEELKKASADADEVGDLKAKLEAVQGALTDALKAAAVASAALAAKEAANAQEEVAEGDVPEDVQDAIAAKRLKLHADARVVLGAKTELPKTAKAIHEAVIAAKLPEMKLDGLDAVVREATFAAIVATASTQPRRNDALANLNANIHQSAVNAARADGEDPVEAARLRMDSRIRKAAGTTTANGDAR